MRFAVIGHPVAHSLSPRIHAANFAALGMDGAEYGAVDVEPGRIAEAFARFAAAGYRGVNVTVPHKLEAMAAVTRLDPSAERAGAVNTVRFEPDGTSTGFNTDLDGFLDSLREAGSDPAGKRVLVLGAGGAARAVAAACLSAGSAALAIANRTRAKADALAAALRGIDPQVEVDGTDPSSEAIVGFGPDLIVNATTVGLRPDDPSAVPPEVLRPGLWVCDIMPVARETATLATARAAGAHTLGGLGMLVAQAARSFEIWTGRRADRRAMQSAIRHP